MQPVAENREEQKNSRRYLVLVGLVLRCHLRRQVSVLRWVQDPASQEVGGNSCVHRQSADTRQSASVRTSPKRRHHVCFTFQRSVM